MNSRLAQVATVASVTFALTAVVTPSHADPGRAVDASGPLTAFPNPYGDGSPNPAAGGTAAVHAVTTGSGRTVVTLHVQGLEPNRDYGAHAHVLGCQTNKAGGHYQDVPGTASPANEIWLDFTTNGAGNGSAQTVVDWVIRAEGANAVVIHDHLTDGLGKAGPKLGCLDVDF